MLAITLWLLPQTMETLALVLVSLASAITMITVGALPFLGRYHYQVPLVRPVLLEISSKDPRFGCSELV